MSHIISFVQEQEYTKVLNENIMLKAKITELYITIDHLNDTIKKNHLTIDLLKEENDMLKMKLLLLEKEFNDIKSQHIELKHNHELLTHKLNSIIEKDEYNKFMIAIQDMNRLFLLEHKNSSFKDLREDRLYTCHYIKDNDQPEMKDAKISVLYEKLQHIHDNIREQFDELYPNVIEDVLLHITPVKVSDKLLKRVYKWWN